MDHGVCLWFTFQPLISQTKLTSAHIKVCALDYSELVPFLPSGLTWFFTSRDFRFPFLSTATFFCNLIYFQNSQLSDLCLSFRHSSEFFGRTEVNVFAEHIFLHDMLAQWFLLSKNFSPTSLWKTGPCACRMHTFSIYIPLVYVHV